MSDYSHNGRRRVVITGLGAVTPLGNDVESSWDGLVSGRSGAATIEQWDASEYPVTFACELKDFDPKEWMEHKQARRMDRFAQMIVAAARQAESDSGSRSSPRPSESAPRSRPGSAGSRLSRTATTCFSRAARTA